MAPHLKAIPSPAYNRHFICPKLISDSISMEFSKSLVQLNITYTKKDTSSLTQSWNHRTYGQAVTIYMTYFMQINCLLRGGGLGNGSSSIIIICCHPSPRKKTQNWNSITELIQACNERPSTWQPNLNSQSTKWQFCRKDRLHITPCWSISR